MTSVEQQLLLAEEDEQLWWTEFEKQGKEFRELFDMAELFQTESAALQEEHQLFNAVR